jgi:hypothetical protein
MRGRRSRRSRRARSAGGGGPASYTPPPCNAVQNIPPCVPFSHSTRRPRVEPDACLLGGARRRRAAANVQARAGMRRVAAGGAPSLAADRALPLHPVAAGGGLAGALPCCLWRAPVRQRRMPRAMEDAESAEVAEAGAGAEG